MANTIDTLGEHATMEAIINRTIESFEDDTVTVLSQRAFKDCTSQQNVKLSACTTIRDEAFMNCSELRTIEVGGRIAAFGADPFYGCSKLTSLILSSPTAMSKQQYYNTISYTNLAKNTCMIYVPDEQVDDYKDKIPGCRHLIFPISDYPRQNVATISDSWDEIVASANDGTCEQKYKVGDTAWMTIGSNRYLFELIAKNMDELSDNSGLARMTWRLTTVYCNYQMQNSEEQSGGWGGSNNIRTWLESDVLPQLPAALTGADGIRSVKKTYYDASSSSTKTSNDKLWLFSSRELIDDPASYKESSGIHYPVFSTLASRIAFQGDGCYTRLWTRTQVDEDTYAVVNTNGEVRGNWPHQYDFNLGVVFGFCLGSVPAYTVTFKNDNGTVLQSSRVAQGVTPVYSGATPVDPIGSEPFTGWDHEISAVGDSAQTYIARYGNKFGVQFKNENGTVLKSQRYSVGQTPSCTTPTDPTSAGRVFKAWSPAIAAVTGNESAYSTPAYVTYTATYKAKLTVTWKNSDGTTLTTTTVDEGDTPVYSGTTPVDPSGDEREFDGWSPAVAPITKNTTYTATYASNVEIVDRTADEAAFFTAIENGTVKDNFKVGNYFTLNLGSTYGTALNAQIAGFGKKTMPDGTPSSVDIVFKDQLQTTHNMNNKDTPTGGWPACAMRKWLANTGSGSVWAAIPSTWRSHIIPIINYSKKEAESSDYESTDKLWIPSIVEMNINTYSAESHGPKYSQLYVDNNSRIKTQQNTAIKYWVRSTFGNDRSFCAIGVDGGFSGNFASAANGVALSFSLGTTTDALKIQDSWDTILANEANGTAASKYPVGSLKAVDLGTEGTITFEVVGHGVDKLADGSGEYAATTWLAKECLNSTHRMNPANTTQGGYPASEMKTWLSETIIQKFPEIIRNNIANVYKYSRLLANNGRDVTSIDKIWIPSLKELGFNPGNDEANSPYYTVFHTTDNAGRIRQINGVATDYWIRYAFDNYNFRVIKTNGGINVWDSNKPLGVVPGFCTNGPQYTVTFKNSDDTTLQTSTVYAGSTPTYTGETPVDPSHDPAWTFAGWTPALGPVNADTTYTAVYEDPNWTELLASISDDTYKTKYSIGDLIPLDLGTEGQHQAQIVAFDEGGSHVTFITKNLLRRNHRMNPAIAGQSGNYTIGTGGIGGWENCEMRTYLSTTIKPLMPTIVRNALVPISKSQYAYDSTGQRFTQTTQDDLWIPSGTEMIETYNGVFSDKDTRKKTHLDSTESQDYWLRNVSQTGGFYYVSSDGTANASLYYDSTNGYRITLGFQI